MSGGFAILGRHTDMGSGHGSGGSGFSDEDLLASLAGFAVEGQTEKDLATIKAMLATSSHGFVDPRVHFQQQQYVQQNQWAGWSTSQYQHQHALGNGNHKSQHGGGRPPPNTPTMSKSLELQSAEAPRSYMSNGNGTSGAIRAPRRRDVSLDRDYVSSSHVSSVQGSAGEALALSMDVDMGDVSELGQSRHAGANHLQGFPSEAWHSSSLHKRNTSVDLMDGIDEDSQPDRKQSPEVPAHPVFTPSSAISMSIPPSPIIRSPTCIPAKFSPTKTSRTPVATDPPITRSRSRQNAAQP
ncbi:MAG: hypothetical protein CYPHOPRED_000088 [Cyphobasidiales sp. Tagirdzhanova-0007]|nr:MAG: hypothetical protein CYPHOPRED_000088 [Cyphobasidiales sp. Tagirdzhanova-0007]